jgi:Ca2+/Na+ antiporter
MYDIRQFRPALYALLILGISGFAIAAHAPGIWLIAMCGIGLNGWLVAIRRFRPIARIVANGVTLGSVLYVIRELVAAPTTPVITIGEFLVFLQLVKLWEQRANRDYAQLLVLSLLLIVAASMNTASLWFGVLLISYLFLSLYCCLLFHLKVETDAAKAAMPVPEDKIAPHTLRQDQRYLSRSMRRLTALVSIVALTFAVGVFLFFPRGSGAGMLGPLQSFRTASALTGFSDSVGFQDVARITQSHETVAFVKAWHNERPITGNETLFLRGLTLDTYRAPGHPGGRFEWTRSISALDASNAYFGDSLELSPPGREMWRQQIALWPTHTDVLFALGGPTLFTPKQRLKVRYTPDDGALQTVAPLNERIDYEVLSSGDLGRGDNRWTTDLPPAAIREQFPKVYDFARKPEVCGSDAHGSLGDQRVLRGQPGPLDAQIASNIESYLRSHFSYTLDLTDEGSFRGREPLETFLYDWKRGHCEYFAGAMTLMCQSLGMQSRMVIGFKCDADDYNSLNGQYTVHDSDAHAWVEVRTAEGWTSYDPTSSREAAVATGSGLLARGRHLLEYLEFTYANAVIAYDSQNRDSVIATIETGLTGIGNRGSDALNAFQIFITGSAGFWNASTIVLTGFLLLMLGVVGAASGWYVWERWQLRKRAQRIGIELLPEADQLRLARQLGFYDELLQLLSRHKIRQPAHFTPLEFSRSLAFLPSDAYDTVQRLTALFYKVRYGGIVLPTARQRRLDNVLGQLSRELEAPQRPEMPGPSVAT